MCEHLRGGGAGGGVKGEEGGEEACAGEGEEGEFGADVVLIVLVVGVGVGGGEAEGAGVGEAFEGRPGLFGGDAAEGEDLCA